MIDGDHFENTPARCKSGEERLGVGFEYSVGVELAALKRKLERPSMTISKVKGSLNISISRPSRVESNCHELNNVASVACSTFNTRSR